MASALHIRHVKPLAIVVQSNKANSVLSDLNHKFLMYVITDGLSAELKVIGVWLRDIGIQA